MTLANRDSLLVVEQDETQRAWLAHTLQSPSFDVHTATMPAQALDWSGEHISVVISRWGFEGNVGGLELLQRWRTRQPETSFVFFSGDHDPHTVQSAVAAIKHGAATFLSVPLDSSTLVESVKACLPRKHVFPDVMGNSAAIRRALDQASSAAAADSTVLVTGESGTGKELLAKGIHAASPRAQGPFIGFNIAAVPDTLIDSELFGHARGAFTGAQQPRQGRFEAADRGTLFIDEIGDAPPHVQAKLLRVLESHRVSRVGENGERQIDVRVITATSRDLEAMVDDGSFRADLYYRLNVVRLPLPPLRARNGDVALLTDYFLERLCERHHRPPLQIGEDLRAALGRSQWPGNVRELRNVIESMVVLAQDDVLTVADLPAWFAASSSHRRRLISIPRNMSLAELERAAVDQALEQAEGRTSVAARILGISARSLQRKIKVRHEAASPRTQRILPVRGSE